MATEEQTDHNFGWTICSATATRAGQKLTISNRQVTKLGFWLYKVNEPTGDVTLTIRKVSDGSLICSKVWGQAEDLTTDPVYEEVEFDTPQTIDEEVRILAEFVLGSSTHQVKIRMQTADVKPDEQLCDYEDTTWTDRDYDCAYIYTYTAVVVTVISSGISSNREAEQGSILTNRILERPGVLSNVESPGGSIFSNVEDERSAIRSGRA